MYPALTDTPALTPLMTSASLLPLLPMAALLALTLTSILKHWVDAHMSADDPLHDLALRLIPILIGGVSSVLNYLFTGQHIDYVALRNAFVLGAGSGAGSIGLYHTITAKPKPKAPTAKE
jgi:hypothetical protein